MRKLWRSWSRPRSFSERVHFSAKASVTGSILSMFLDWPARSEKRVIFHDGASFGNDAAGLTMRPGVSSNNSVLDTRCHRRDSQRSIKRGPCGQGYAYDRRRHGHCRSTGVAKRGQQRPDVEQRDPQYSERLRNRWVRVSRGNSAAAAIWNMRGGGRGRGRVVRVSGCLDDR